MNNSKEIEALQQDMSRIAKRLEKLAGNSVENATSTLNDYVDAATESIKDFTGNATNTVKEQALIAKERATKVAKQTNQYAQENPWAIAGIAAGAALVIGLLAASRRNRD